MTPNAKLVRRAIAVGAAALLLCGCGTLLSGTHGATGQGLSVSPNSNGGASEPGTTAGSAPAGESGSQGGVTSPRGTGSSSSSLGGGSPVAGAGGPTGSTPTGVGGVKVAPGPIQVGFVLTQTSNVGSYGFSYNNSYSEQQVDQGLVNAVNAQGGLDGHQIIPVFANTDTGSTNWSSDFAAACATFTQDHHVVAVLGYEFNYDPAFESCLANAGVVHLVAGFNIPDQKTLQPYPNFWSMAVPDIDSRSLAKFDGAMATGYLTSANRLGILTDDCPGTQSAWKGVVQPFLSQHNLNVATTFEIGCATGNNASEAAEINDVPNIVLQFRSNNVDRVVFVTVSEAPELYLFGDTAETQGYHPGYIVSSLAQLSLLTGEMTSDQLQNVHGFGWLPSQDVSPSQYSPPNAAQARCLSLLKSQGIVPKVAADYGYAYAVCDPVFLYDQTLRADGGQTKPSAVSASVAAVGNGFQSVLLLNGESVYSSSRQDDPAAVYRPLVWNGGCSCFVYTGSTYQMP